MFADFLVSVSCAEDIENDDLETVLSSNKGCHSKITHDELFRVNVQKRRTQYDSLNVLQMGEGITRY